MTEAIEEIETLDSDRPSVEVNIRQSPRPKLSLIPKPLDTPLKKLAALLIAGALALIAEIIRQIVSK